MSSSKRRKEKKKKRNDVKGWDVLKKVASCHMHHSPKKEIIIKGMKTIVFIRTILQHFYKMLI